MYGEGFEHERLPQAGKKHGTPLPLAGEGRVRADGVTRFTPSALTRPAGDLSRKRER